MTQIRVFEELWLPHWGLGFFFSHIYLYIDIYVFRETLCRIRMSQYFMFVLISWSIASQRLFFSSN